MTKKRVEMWCDGACSGNPGVGGWAAILRYGNHERVLSGMDPAATNNEMEVMAIIEGLGALTEPCEVTIYTDSNNAIGWISKGWKCRANLYLANLVRAAQDKMGGHDVTFVKVKGHSGDPMNERVDELAVQARLKGAA